MIGYVIVQLYHNEFSKEVEDRVLTRVMINEEPACGIYPARIREEVEKKVPYITFAESQKGEVIKMLRKDLGDILDLTDIKGVMGVIWKWNH